MASPPYIVTCAPGRKGCLKQWARNAVGSLTHRIDNSSFRHHERETALTEHHDSLDATGLVCPEPLMLVRNRVRELEAGQVLHVLATDPSTSRDLHNFCRFMGHEMVATEQQDDVYVYFIRKKDG